MKIALLADAGSIHTQRWAKALAGRGHRVAIWSERAWAATPSGIGVYPIAPAKKWRRNMLSVMAMMRAQIKQFRPDVVHAHYASRYGLYGALLPFRPLIISVWGADVEVFPTRRPVITRRMLRWIFSQANAVTATSRYLQNVTQQFTAKSVAVVPFGIDQEEFAPVPFTEGPLKWVINKGLEPVYGIDVAITAWAQVAPSLSWQGRIVGEGSERGRLEHLVNVFHLRDKISFSGHLTGNDLREALQWADVGIYPSRRESFGVAPLEMMALGRWVIARNVGGLPEVVSDGYSGQLVDSDDPSVWSRIFQIGAEDPVLWRNLARNGPKWVKDHYNLESSLQYIEDLYGSLVRMR